MRVYIQKTKNPIVIKAISTFPTPTTTIKVRAKPTTKIALTAVRRQIGRFFRTGMYSKPKVMKARPNMPTPKGMTGLNMR